MSTVPAFALVLGATVGSFVTVIAHRLPRGEGWVTGRSRCPSCETRIAAYDNVPVLSWLALRGRCRSCHTPISMRYPLAELALGLSFAGTYVALGPQDLGALALGLAFCTVLVTITLTDLERRVIPNKVVLAGAIAAIAIAAVSEPSSLGERGIAAAGAGGALLLVALAYPRGMGMGDVKLVAMMGLYLGTAVVPALLTGFLAGALVGSGLIAKDGSAARKRAIAFGPFLALGGIVGLWFGDAIVAWYVAEFFAA